MTSRISYLWGILFLLLFWQVSAWLAGESLLVGPGPVLKKLYVESQLKRFWLHVGYSSLRIVAALVASFLVAVPLGLLVGSSKNIDRLAQPIIYLTYPVPKIIFLPVVFIVFGLGDLGKIVMLSIILFFQLFITTRDAARSVSRSARYSLYSLGGSRWDLFFHVIWPSCLPAVFTAMRIATGTVIAVLFFVESIGTRYGLGFFILDGWGRADIPAIMLGMVVMAVLGVILYEIFEILEKMLCRWNQI